MDTLQPGTTASSSVVSDIHAIRSRLTYTFIRVLAIVSVPAVIASLSRIPAIGWQPIWALHILMSVTLCGMTLFKTRVSVNIQGVFIVVMSLAIGLGGLSQLGLVAAGSIFLVAAAPIATLLFGARAGLATLVVTTLAVVLLAYLTINGTLQNEMNLGAYVVATPSWSTFILSLLLSSTSVTIALHIFNQGLITALTTSREKQDELSRHQKKLEKTIAERDQKNQELQQALDEIKKLQGIIPICSYCHSIRNDDGAWNKIESYLASHADAQLSHGVCPDCMNKAYKDAGLDHEIKPD